MKKNFSSVAIALGLLLSSGVAVIKPAMAQRAETVAQSVIGGLISFRPPADDPYPEQTRGGATRGRCQATSLMPRNGSGLTMHERASVYVHVSKHPEAELDQAILTLKSDADGNEQYDAIVELPEASLSMPGGVLEIEFPESIPDLEVGKQYSWSLIMMCDGQPVRPDSPVVGGGIRRVAPTSAVAMLTGMTPTERAIAYGEAGLWYDLLSTLASNPPEATESVEFSEAWKRIMTEVGISEEIATSTVIN